MDFFKADVSLLNSESILSSENILIIEVILISASVLSNLCLYGDDFSVFLKSVQCAHSIPELRPIKACHSVEILNQ